MKVKTSELIDQALDFAVAKCLHPDWEDEDLVTKVTTFDEFDGNIWNYSTDWEQGGPIIEYALIYVKPTTRLVKGWRSYQLDQTQGGICNSQYGKTPLIAAMRCYVSSKFGDEVEIPETLYEN